MRKIILILVLLINNCSNELPPPIETKTFTDYPTDAGPSDTKQVDTITAIDTTTNTTDSLMDGSNLIDPTTLFKSCDNQSISIYKLEELIVDCHNISDCVYDRIYHSGIQWKCAVYLGDLILKGEGDARSMQAD